mmetsp:Transcript_23383/g.73198  ORF Transcript_23383/g.73198 Transcript_23383/m.73198 type:complete len:259 (-) Transcript_23383:34-810(-)
MVSAGLPVQGGEDRKALVLDHLARPAQGGEVPAGERVVVRVDVRGDEAPSPVHPAAHGCYVALGQGGEVVQPVARVRKLRDLPVLQPLAFHDVPLVGGRAGLGHGLGLLRLELGGVRLLLGPRRCLGRLRLGSFCLGVGEHGGVAIEAHLPGQLVRTGLDGHPRAVEGEGEERVLAAEAVVRARELQLGQAEGMAEVQEAVHVGIREVAIELVVRVGLHAGGSVHLEHLGVIPLLLSGGLDLEEEIAPRRVLRNVSHG